MKVRSLLVAALVTLGCSGLFAQELVDNTVTNKKAVLEEFTGTSCPACPGGHNTVSQMLDADPDNTIVIGCSPNNSSLTPPYQAGDPDLRRAFLDPFYTTPYYGSSRSMPSGHINRRVFGAERKLSTGQWSSSAATIKQEVSPLNIGLESTYDAGANTLTVDVEVLFTDDVTDPVSINVYVLEDSIMAGQAGAGATYWHYHVFRESLTPVWGDAITGNTNNGDLATATYTLDLSTATDAIDMSHAEVVAFVNNNTSEEIVTARKVHADGGTTRIAPPASIEELGAVTFNLYPNPTSSTNGFEVVLNKQVEENATLTVYNNMGQDIYNEELPSGTLSANVSAEKVTMAAGIYFVKIQQGESAITKKVIVE